MACTNVNLDKDNQIDNRTGKSYMKHTSRRTLHNACFLASLIAAVGCSKGPKLPTVPVSGTVTLDGTPLEGASVAFSPSDMEGKPANGITNAEGKFTLKTFLGGTEGQADGALAGDYTVMVTKYEAQSGSAPPDNSSTGDYVEQQKKAQEAMKSNTPLPPQSQGAAKLVTPPKYANPKETDLKASIKPSGNPPITLELKS